MEVIKIETGGDSTLKSAILRKKLKKTRPPTESMQMVCIVGEGNFPWSLVG